MKQKIEVNDILNEFISDFESLGDEALKRYVMEYPELTETLYRRAGIARMFSRLPDTELSPEEEQLLNLRASSVVQNLIFEMNHLPTEAAEAGKSESTEFASLIDGLKGMGETFESASAKLRLSPLILKLLDKRRVRPDSLPRFLVEKLAEILRTNFEEVYRYISLEPIQSGGFYKADSAPAFNAQFKFADLVKYDPDLDSVDKEYWLSFPKIEE